MQSSWFRLFSWNPRVSAQFSCFRLFSWIPRVSAQSFWFRLWKSREFLQGIHTFLLVQVAGVSCADTLRIHENSLKQENCADTLGFHETPATWTKRNVWIPCRNSRDFHSLNQKDCADTLGIHKKFAAPCKHHKPPPPKTRILYSQETARSRRASKPTYLHTLTYVYLKNIRFRANPYFQISSLMYQFQCNPAKQWAAKLLLYFKHMPTRLNDLGELMPTGHNDLLASENVT